MKSKQKRVSASWNWHTKVKCAQKPMHTQEEGKTEIDIFFR